MNSTPPYVYIDNDKEAEKAVKFLSAQPRLGYDVETTGLDIVGNKAKLLLMQLGTEDIVYVFDPRPGKVNPLVLKDILESNDILKIGHNLKFDYQVTKHQTGMVLSNVFDTMLAYRLLTSGLIEDGRGGYIANGFRDKGKKRFPYKGLNFLTQKYLGITLDKDTRETFINFPYDGEFSERQLAYAADDIFYLHPLCDILSQDLVDEDLIETAILEFEFILPASEMELNGAYVNKTTWRSIIKEAQRKATEHADIIGKIVSPLAEQNSLFGAVTVNISSQDQLLPIFSKLGYKLESTDKKVLKSCDHPLAAELLNFRAYDKLVSTYGEPVLKKINRVTNRLHFTLHQLGTDTGRLSSEKPNIQNMPNDRDGEDTEVKLSFRDCFQAEEGNVLLTADYSQCELRILAEISQDTKFMEIFKTGGDLHIITSQEVFGYSDEDLATYKKVKQEDHPSVSLEDIFPAEEVAVYYMVSDLRGKTKAINFGIAYGLSAFSLSEDLKIPLSEAEKILEDYVTAYSGIKRWLDKNGREAIANRFSRTILGRKRYYKLPPPDDEKNFRRSRGAIRRAGNNAVIQGTNADITKEALIRLQEAYRSIEGAKLLFTVHDEIVSECPKERAEEVATVKATIMRDAFHRFIKTVPVGTDDKVSVTIANCWSK